MADARAGTFAAATSTGSQTFDTGLGVTPDALILIVGPIDGTAAYTYSSTLSRSVGLCDGSLNQHATGIYWPTNLSAVATGTAGKATSYAILVPNTTEGSIQVRASVTALNSDGTVDLNWTHVSGSAFNVGFLALSGVTSVCGTCNVPTTSDENVGFTPDFVLFSGGRVSASFPNKMGIVGFQQAAKIWDTGTMTESYGSSGHMLAMFSPNSSYQQVDGGWGEFRNFFGITFSDDTFYYNIITNGFNITRHFNSTGTTLSPIGYLAISGVPGYLGEGMTTSGTDVLIDTHNSPIAAIVADDSTYNSGGFAATTRTSIAFADRYGGRAGVVIGGTQDQGSATTIVGSEFFDTIPFHDLNYAGFIGSSSRPDPADGTSDIDIVYPHGYYTATSTSGIGGNGGSTGNWTTLWIGPVPGAFVPQIYRRLQAA